MQLYLTLSDVGLITSRVFVLRKKYSDYMLKYRIWISVKPSLDRVLNYEIGAEYIYWLVIWISTLQYKFVSCGETNLLKYYVKILC